MTLAKVLATESLADCEPSGRVVRAVSQPSMASVSSSMSVEVHVSSKQLTISGRVVWSVLLSTTVQAALTSTSDLFAGVSIIAPAKAVALAAKTMKMVENRMMKRFEKAD